MKEILVLRIKNRITPDEKAMAIENQTAEPETNVIVPSPSAPAELHLTEDSVNDFATAMTLRIVFQDGKFYVLHNEEVSTLKEGDSLVNKEVAIDIQLENLSVHNPFNSTNNEATQWKNFIGNESTLLLAQVEQPPLEVNYDDLLSHIDPNHDDPLGFLFGNTPAADLINGVDLERLEDKNTKHLAYPDRSFKD